MIIIENLNIFSLIKLFTLIINKRLKFNDYHIYYINNSRFFRIFDRFFLSIFSSRLKKLKFKYENLKDENDTNYGFYRINDDISDILKTISFEKYLDNERIYSLERTYAIGYIKKILLGTWPGDAPSPLQNFLLMTKAVVIDFFLQ